MEELNVDKVREQIIVKANDLINKSKYDFSKQEFELMYYLLCKIRPTDTEFREEDFIIADFCRVIGITTDSGKTYVNIKNTIESIFAKNIWLTLEEGKEQIFRWLDIGRIDYNNGIITLKLSDDLKPYLLNVKEKFTVIKFNQVLPFESKYSFRIFEFMRANQYKKEFSIRVAELKNSLNCTEYKNFSHFKKNVLDVSKREINLYTEIYIEYLQIHRGKQVVSLIFTIREKELEERLEAQARVTEKLSAADDYNSKPKARKPYPKRSPSELKRRNSNYDIGVAFRLKKQLNFDEHRKDKVKREFFTFAVDYIQKMVTPSLLIEKTEVVDVKKNEFINRYTEVTDKHILIAMQRYAEYEEHFNCKADDDYLFLVLCNLLEI